MSRPKCPNHVIEMDKTDTPRIWICPISGAQFEADADEQERDVKYDKFGRPMITYKLTQLNGTGG